MEDALDQPAVSERLLGIVEEEILLELQEVKSKAVSKEIDKLQTISVKVYRPRQGS